MAHLNSSYIDILNAPGNPSEKFWTLEKRIKQDKRHPGVIVEISKKNVIPTILVLLNDQAITDTDLSEFSEELRNALAYFSRGV